MKGLLPSVIVPVRSADHVAGRQEKFPQTFDKTKFGCV